MSFLNRVTAVHCSTTAYGTTSSAASCSADTMPAHLCRCIKHCTRLSLSERDGNLGAVGVKRGAGGPTCHVALQLRKIRVHNSLRLDLSWTTAGIHTRLLKPSLPLPRSFRCVDAYRSSSPASGPMLQAFSSDFLCFFPVKAHAHPSDFAVCSIVHCYCQTCPSVALSSNEEFDNGSAVSLIHGSG